MHRGVDGDGPVEAKLPARHLVRHTARARVRLRLRLRLGMRIRGSVWVKVLRETSPGSSRGTSAPERMRLREAERRLLVMKLGHTARVCCASSFIVTCVQSGLGLGFGLGLRDRVGVSATVGARVRVRVRDRVRARVRARGSRFGLGLWLLARQLEVLDAVEDDDLVAG